MLSIESITPYQPEKLVMGKENDFVIIKLTDSNIGVGDCIINQQLQKGHTKFLKGFIAQVKPKNSNDKLLVHKFLKELTRIEPNYHYVHDTSNGQMLLNILGDTHKSFLVEHIYNQTGIEVIITFSDPIVCRQIVQERELMMRVNQSGNKFAATIQLKNNRVKELKGFINELKQQEELLTTFDEQLFNTFVEKIEIHQDKTVTITLKNGEAISQ